MAAPRPTACDARLGAKLEELCAGADVVARRAADPVSFVHRFADPADQELVGLLAAALAFGNVTAVRASIARVLDVLGERPARAVAERSEAALRRALRGFVHRVYRGDHVAGMLARAGALQREAGALGAAFAQAHEATPLREALARFADPLRPSPRRSRDGAPDVGARHLVPDPRSGSACKRLLLYLRWMVRPADGVDLGIWRPHGLAPAMLIIPVDTHILRIGQNLGLTRRRDASWRTAEEITASLRRFDPMDPVRFDFALCHLGVSRECPSRRDPIRCEACALRTVCLQWRTRSPGRQG
ncbi:MAG: TIGR02757 family protein [Myxococcales bacterium]|nr:TIGR02757 family protein [Myxococcales bacterium]